MRLYLDCRAGISGDMVLAALCHLGLDLEPFQELLRGAGIECSLRQWPEHRAAGPGFRAEVTWRNPQPLRHPEDMATIMARVAVSARVRRKALDVLDALAHAEAHAHNIPLEEVHFHEVGAIDTLADILGTVWGLERLGVSGVTASPLPWFSGTVECEHGALPLPAPATAWLMQDKPVFPTEARTELITPTGAALVHVLAENFAEGPEGVLRRLGTGYGARQAPAGLRAWLLDAAADAAEMEGVVRERVTVLESHMDHLSGEDLGAALEALAAMPQALDVLWLPGVGKKNRPAGSLRVLCLPEHADAVCAAVFRHTHTLGLRCHTLQRRALPREECTLDTECGPLRAKRYTLGGREYVRPESDDLRAAAARCGVGVPGLTRGLCRK